ncbi:hypothetical protein ACFRK5_36110 [Streptomyces niveus]|uniref:hypothetical protein n=1 Tax=Streptomyces niveus TaxID=193462 RepID=UPI0036B849CE
MTLVVGAKAAEVLDTGTDRQEELLAGQTCGGPGCRVVLWAGVRRRRTARYCGGRCRQAAYRVRRARRNPDDHDAVP